MGLKRGKSGEERETSGSNSACLLSLLVSLHSFLLLLSRRFPRHRAAVLVWRVRSQLPLRGSAGMALAGVTGFPFNPAGSVPPEPTGHKIVGAMGRVNTKSCGNPIALAAQAICLPQRAWHRASRRHACAEQQHSRWQKRGVPAVHHQVIVNLMPGHCRESPRQRRLPHVTSSATAPTPRAPAAPPACPAYPPSSCSPRARFRRRGRCPDRRRSCRSGR